MMWLVLFLPWLPNWLRRPVGDPGTTPTLACPWGRWWHFSHGLDMQTPGSWVVLVFVAACLSRQDWAWSCPSQQEASLPTEMRQPSYAVCWQLLYQALNLEVGAGALVTLTSAEEALPGHLGSIPSMPGRSKVLFTLPRDAVASCMGTFHTYLLKNTTLWLSTSFPAPKIQVTLYSQLMRWWYLSAHLEPFWYYLIELFYL